MEDQDLSSFLAACAKQFCPWCGTPVGRNANGRPRKFCSDKCRYDFWNYEKRHKAEKMEMEVRLSEREVRLSESSRAKGAAGRRSETG